MAIRSKIIDIACRCGYVLFRYQKIGKGKLVRCYLPRILSNHAGFSPRVAIATDIPCPSCRKRIGTIAGIKGTRAVKLNQGQIRPFRLG